MVKWAEEGVEEEESSMEGKGAMRLYAKVGGEELMRAQNFMGVERAAAHSLSH